MLTKYLSKQIIYWKIPLLIKLIINLMVFKRNLLLKKLWKFKDYTNIESIKEFNIDKNSFNPKYRKNWISFFSRLKNAEDFLYETVISHEPFADEIILVDNNSTDNTKQICLDLVKEFPNKIKFYEYTNEVYPVWDNRWDKKNNNSIHSLSYYYNWTMAKTTYKFVAKLDDDMIIFDKTNLKKIIENIKNNWIDYLQIIPQLNLKIINWEIKTPLKLNSNILPPIAWLYLDHWIFPISELTYFINSNICETFLFPFNVKITKPLLFHLKWLKWNMWLHNMKWNVIKDLKNDIEKAQYLKLPKKLLKKFNYIMKI